MNSGLSPSLMISVLLAFHPEPPEDQPELLAEKVKRGNDL